jgi:predicted O-methyltransferase YrrM
VSKSFDELWRFITTRSVGFPTVQEYHELEHLFDLMQGCESYLEVGAAEGNSLYVLAHALKQGAEIHYIDWDEDHTRAPRVEILKLLQRAGYNVTPIHGNTHDPIVIQRASARQYDVVLIDAGHSYDDVMQDARNYGHLATKYLIFHDVCLPEVNRAFEQYAKGIGASYYRRINSETFGYGIIRK